MGPDTGFLFLALGAILFSGVYQNKRGAGRSSAVVIAGLASFYGLLKFVETLVGIDLTFQGVLFPDTERLGAVALRRMSPLTGILFFLSGLALLAGLLGRTRRLPREAAGSLGLAVLVAGGVAVTGYLFGTPVLYGGATVPLAATTAGAFLFLGIGLTAAAGRDSFLVREVSGPMASARLLRSILPIIVLAILLEGLLAARLGAGFRANAALLSALLTLIFMAITVVVIVRIARSVFRRAEEAEAERRRTEEQLLIKEAALDSSMSAIGLSSMDGTLIYANKAYFDLWGGRSDDFLGKPLLENADHEKPVREVVGSLMSGRNYVGEKTARLKDGRDIVVLMSANVVTSSDGRPICMMASFIDITERRRAEKELRESEERFRQIAENEGEFIWEVDAAGLYTYASPVIERILGFKPVELVGKMHFFDLFAPDVREERKAAALAVFARKESFQEFMNPNLRKDGERVILATSGSPILDEGGNLLGYRGADQDITDRVRAEEALRDSVKQKEILMKELQHRVKNSLAVVSGLLGLGMEAMDDEAARMIFTETRSRIRSVASLYEQLYGSDDPVNINLCRYIQRLVELFTKTYIAGPERIVFTPRVDEFQLDTRRAVPLGLILNELITNSLKYAYPGQGQGLIRIDLERSGDSVALGVSDDGPGLPKGFDPKTSGGLGWSLIRMLTEEIGGELNFPPGPPGTRVVVRFKL